MSPFFFANAVVADAEVIADYYRQTYELQTSVIAYGAERLSEPPAAQHVHWSLTAGEYLLYVSRLEPENNALGVIEAYVESEVKLPLVVVGDAPYADSYKASLASCAQRVHAPGRVVFTGFQFGSAYRELRENCYAYVQATEVGGTHPALLEAMAHGNCIIANDVPEHREVLAEAGLFYPKNDFSQLARLIRNVCLDTKAAKEMGLKAQLRAQEQYDWEIITNKYEHLLSKLALGD